MSQRSISRFLMILGAIFVAYGFFMDTTVPCNDYSDDRCLNMYKQAQQTRYLIGGGIVLLGGILLFGFRTLKQTRDEEKREREADAAAAKRRGERFEEVVNSATRSVLEIGRNAGRFFDLGAERSEYWSRSSVGVVVGIWLGFVYLLLHGILIGDGGLLFGLLVVAACVGFAFRAAPQLAVMKKLWSAAVVVASIMLALATYTVVKLRVSLATDWVPQQDGYSEFVNEVIRTEQAFALYLLVFAISAVAFLLTKRAERKAAG